MTHTYKDLFAVFGRIGLLSFGGPAAQIALMHRELVEERQWISDKDFLGALSFCMLLPGPEAMQLATYTGWKLRGVLGGLLAGALFVLPGAFVILALAILYVEFGQVPLVQIAFTGIKAAVIAIVLQALWKVSQKAMTRPVAWLIACTAFVAIFGFGVSFVLIILCAAVLGALLLSEESVQISPAVSSSTGNTYLQIPLWLSLWIVPIVFVYLIDHSFLTELALFFSKLAVVTFGGAYAVLAYMTQTVTQEFGWITTPQMIDALGLAETTPGPLILVTEFVALLAGFQEGGYRLMLLAGTFALWCTFVPCFLWIFAAAPYVDRILAQPRLKAALSGISAAVVGVILNLSFWFAANVFFEEPDQFLANPWGTLDTFDPLALALMLLCAYLLMFRKVSLPMILFVAMGLSVFSGFTLG